MERRILHIDVNNAFLSWTAVEMLKNGSKVDIRTIPSIIGGDESARKGVVVAKSYKAKACGVMAGEPIYLAKRKCNNLKVFQGDYKAFKKYSDSLYHLFLEYTDKVERFSIDECFLDMTFFTRDNNELYNKAKEIKDRIENTYGFTVNIGISNRKVLAKMASDFEKPNKIHTLYINEIEKKMWPLDISDLLMIGKKTVPKLRRMRINKIGDLANTNILKMIATFGKQGKLIWEYANGIDDSEVNSVKEESKGIGKSVTVPYDLYKKEDIQKIILILVEDITYNLRKNNRSAQVITLQLKNSKFEVKSHQRKVVTPLNNTIEIYNIAKELLNNIYNSDLIRLIGIRLEGLVNENEKQISVFDSIGNNKKSEIDKVMDNIKEKYGYDMIKRANEFEGNKILKTRKNTDDIT